MRSSRFALPSVLVLAVVSATARTSPSRSAQTPQQNPQAVSLLQAAVQAMATTLPSDSTASGTIAIVAGSQTSTGTILILTLGTNQSSEQITLPQSTYALTYSQGLADETINSATTSVPLERAVTSQSVCFPLPFLAAALANAGESIQYIALETAGQQSLQHIRIQNTFASQPDFQQFAEFAIFDVWLDATTNLPQRISFVRRNGGGAAPRILVDAYYSSYKTTSSIAYPMQINLSLNSTPWTTITIGSVAFNTGLTNLGLSTQ
jgi:hypothetical protein